jgi:hypothetical protein
MCTIINVTRAFVHPQTIKTGANRGENWERKETKKNPIKITKKCPFSNQIIPFTIFSRKEEKELIYVFNELKNEAKYQKEYDYQMAA